MHVKYVFVVSSDLVDFFATTLNTNVPRVLCAVPDYTDPASVIAMQSAISWGGVSDTCFVVAILSSPPCVDFIRDLATTAGMKSMRVVSLMPDTVNVQSLVPQVPTTAWRITFDVTAATDSLAFRNAMRDPTRIDYHKWHPTRIRMDPIWTTVNDADIDSVLIVFTYDLSQQTTLFSAFINITIDSAIMSASTWSSSVLQWCCGIIGVAISNVVSLQVVVFARRYAAMLQPMVCSMPFAEIGSVMLSDNTIVHDDTDGLHLPIASLGSRCNIAVSTFHGNDASVQFLHNRKPYSTNVNVVAQSIYFQPFLRRCAIVSWTPHYTRIYFQGTYAPLRVLDVDSYVWLNFNTYADISCDMGSVTLTWQCRSNGINKVPVQFVGATLSSITVYSAS